METQLHLLFPPSVPLIPLLDMYIAHDKDKEKPFILNILMDKAEMDLLEVFKRGGYQPMNLQEFFPVFRDCILGLTFMHMNNIVHRDIKPGNVMAMNKNRYVIADYGEGLNLTFKNEYSDDLFF